MNHKRIALLLSLSIGAIAVVLWLLGGSGAAATAGFTPSTAHASLRGAMDMPVDAQPADATRRHYVALDGTDAGDCSIPAEACRTPQYAVNQAADGDEVRVAAGVYTGVNTYGGLGQLLYLSKTVTIRGGYTTTLWNASNPISYPTTLDAEGKGRVVTIIGAISPTLEGLLITGGDATGLGGVQSEYDAGGGLYVLSATVTVRDSEIFSNTAYLGAGLCLYNSSPTLTGNRIFSNTTRSEAEGRGGGLFMGHSAAKLSGNTISRNTAYEGGGLYLEASDAELSGNTIAGNIADTDGGGLIVYQSSPTLRDSTISHNISHRWGGGLALIDSPATLESNTVFSNTAGDLGGGLYLSSSDAVLSGNGIISNTSQGSGGGLRLIQSEASLQGNVISRNSASVWGGGLYLTASDATLTNNVVVDNAVGVAGGGLYIGGSSPRLLHSTIARNSGGDESGVLVTEQWGPSSTAILTNTIVTSHGVGVKVTPDSGVTLNGVLWHANTIANVGGGGSATIAASVVGDPALALDGYHIGPGSAALDGGVDAGVHADIDGHYRPYGAAPDLGVDELIAVTVAPGAMSTLTYADTRGIPTVIEAPAGAVTQTVLLVYTPVATVTAPADVSFAGRAFELEAYRNGDWLSHFEFEAPVTVTVHYTDSDVVGLYEDTLELRYWSGGEWVDAATTCGTPVSYTRRLDGDWFAGPVCHLSLFGAFASEIIYDTHLPVMMADPDLPERPEPPEPAPSPQRFTRWRSAEGDFAAWERDGVRLTVSDTLELDPATASTGTDQPGGYYGRNFYNGGSYVVGEALGPIVSTTVTFTQAIASWNADTPEGTWIETRISAQLGDGWTKWYNLGVWAADSSTVERHSVKLQGDNNAVVAVDTLVVINDEDPLKAYRLKLRLFSEDGVALPTVRNVSLAVSEPPAEPDALAPGNPDRWDDVLAVPECSQMVYSGGAGWCSPTSTSMVLGYWADGSSSCETRVRAAVEGVYDWLYDGHGNWPFNTAYAATYDLEGYVARLTSLAQAEEWIAAGVPVVVSLAWGPGELTGAPLWSSPGHLVVLVGFDADGDPVVNDPAASSDAEVQRTYIREQFESLWLKHTHGTVYLIYPPGWTVPDW